MKRKARRPDKPSKPPAIDWLVGRVVDSARNVVDKALPLVRATEDGRQRTCLLIVDGSDRVAQAYYDQCLQTGMRSTPLKPHVITTSTQPFQGVMSVAQDHYVVQQHVEPELGPGEVRAVVLTLGTLTIVRLGRDGAPRMASPSYRSLRPDTLLSSVACWHNDHPEGFLIRGIFRTREQGERFLARYEQQRAEVDASGPTREAIEQELAHFKVRYPGDVPLEIEARTYAQVGWLEDRGYLPGDRFSGLEFMYGSEMDLEHAEQLIRTYSGPARGLN